MHFYPKSDEEYAKALQQQFDLESNYTSPPPIVPEPHTDRITFEDILSKVCEMPHNNNANTLADNFGLSITNVTWEDNARNKGSSWGPCISDMTLNVEGRNLPVIRSPNYEDITWDVEIGKIPLLVGNEHGEVMFQTSLREYLDNFRDYLHDPSSWKGTKRSLLRDDDTHVIMSSQACFLPIHADGGETSFNVSIFNYQTRPNDPAVLAIVASSNGTSAQIVDSSGSQKLYFNQKGERCSFVGKRLSQHRVEQGIENDGSPMTDEEKEKNMLLIIQVPLKQKEIERRREMKCLSVNSFSAFSSMPMNVMLDSNFQEEVDVEDAIITVGDAEGPFKEVGNLAIERDPRYPIRVTLQYYKATSNGAVDEEVMSQIYGQLVESRSYGENVGSLVVGGDTGRPTEFTNTKYGGYPLPVWWNEFWIMYGPVFTQYTEEEAADKVFVNGRFCQSSLSQSKARILSILGDGDNNTVLPNPEPITPPWGMMKLD